MKTKRPVFLASMETKIGLPDCYEYKETGLPGSYEDKETGLPGVYENKDWSS